MVALRIFFFDFGIIEIINEALELYVKLRVEVDH
jgi:hypothetical protein